LPTTAPSAYTDMDKARLHLLINLFQIIGDQSMSLPTSPLYPNIPQLRLPHLDTKPHQKSSSTISSSTTAAEPVPGPTPGCHSFADGSASAPA